MITIWLTTLTSRQQGLSDFRRLHGLTLPPDGDDDDGVAGGDDDGGDEEERGADQGHVEFPMPLFRELDPTLDTVLCIVLRNRQVIKKDDGNGECYWENPGRGNQPLCSPPWKGKALNVFDLVGEQFALITGNLR